MDASTALPGDNKEDVDDDAVSGSSSCNSNDGSLPGLTDYSENDDIDDNMDGDGEDDDNATALSDPCSK